MGAVNLKTKKPVSQLTASDLKETVRTAGREVMREEITSVHVDSRGYLIFPLKQNTQRTLKRQRASCRARSKRFSLTRRAFASATVISSRRQRRRERSRA